MTTPKETVNNSFWGDSLVSFIVIGGYNYFSMFDNYLNMSERLKMSLLIALPVALISNLIKPTVKKWLRTISQKNATTAFLVLYALLFILFGVTGAISKSKRVYYYQRPWSTLLRDSVIEGLVMGLFIAVVLTLIKNYRSKKRLTATNEL